MSENIYRHGNHIRLGNGITATERMEGNLPALTIKKNGKVTETYRGSSLSFGNPLSDKDKEFLMYLCEI